MSSDAGLLMRRIFCYICAPEMVSPRSSIGYTCAGCAVLVRGIRGRTLLAHIAYPVADVSSANSFRRDAYRAVRGALRR
ncbi:hypothetical protein KCP70_15230 [Salmonella enterica subsp. enterica]|nr:hypothetical protein KCP70_15230 [Salmonella enterica subsp. enterica]